MNRILRRSLHLVSEITLLLVVMTGCATNPVTGKKELRLISQDQEISIGKENYAPTLQSQGGPYTIDPELSKYVNAVGQKLAKVSDRPQLPYEFVVLNNSVPNAWALPGGKIATNTGLLLELKSEAELAAVLGHEIVHAAARHGAKSMERGILLSAGVAGVAIVTGDSDYSQLAVGAAAVGSQLVNTKYGRDAELESDKYGITYMVRAGYDPMAAVDLQKTFVRLANGKQPSWLEGLFASHPPSQERVDANLKIARAIGKNGKTGEQEYQTRIAHLIKTKPAYDALNQARTALQNNDTATALSLADKAIKIEPKEALFYGVKGDVYAKKEQFQQAEKYYGDAIKRNNEFFLYYLQRGLVREKLNKLNPAKSDLNDSIKLLPTAPAHYALGNIALKQGDKNTAKEHFAKVAAAQGDIGEKAAASLAKLELNSQPEKYLATQLYQASATSLGVAVQNNSRIKVKGVSIKVTQFAESGAEIKSETVAVKTIMNPEEISKSPLKNIDLPSDAQKYKYRVDIISANVAE